MSTRDRAKELIVLATRALNDDQDLHTALRYLKMSQELHYSEKIKEGIRIIEEAIAEEAESSGIFLNLNF